jgi:hypothetical protein
VTLGPGGQFILPPLKRRSSPNQSSRYGAPIIGVVMHDTESSYGSAINWLCTPTYYNADGSVRSGPDASAHVVVREDGNEATQLVPWMRKAWHAMAANQHFIGVEMAGYLNREGSDEWHSAARIAGYLCTSFGIPPVWNVRHGGAFAPGLVRHRDLGVAGGGHLDPTSSDDIWLRFIFEVQHEVARGGYLPQWGVN